MSSDTYCHLPLQVRMSASYARNFKGCHCFDLYIQRSSQTSTYYSWRENIQMSSLSSIKTVRKGNLTSHQACACSLM